MVLLHETCIHSGIHWGVCLMVWRFRTGVFGVSWFVVISYFHPSLVCFPFIFVSFLSVFSPPLGFTFLFSKDEDFYLQHTLLVLSSVFVRRDSSVIKEEIKAFLANRRISQAVVAQVTGKSRRALYSRIMSRLCPLCRCWDIAFISMLQPCQLGHGDGSLGFKPVPLLLGHAPLIFFKFMVVNFVMLVIRKKIPVL